MERSLVLSIVILALINIFDSVSNSVVGPSLIFYVTEMGGTKEQYGLIMSISFLVGMVMMPVYGAWVDSNGNRVRILVVVLHSLSLSSPCNAQDPMTTAFPISLQSSQVSRAVRRVFLFGLTGFSRVRPCGGLSSGDCGSGDDLYGEAYYRDGRRGTDTSI